MLAAKESGSYELNFLSAMPEHITKQAPCSMLFNALC